MLTSSQAPFVASFLYREFIAENKWQIAEQELISRLEGFIELLNQGRTDSLFPNYTEFVIVRKEDHALRLYAISVRGMNTMSNAKVPNNANQKSAPMVP
ncbi:MAG: DUF3375 family protein [Desulfosporosinus sp.]|nr:DUF3375 family protein [Desulfosporosinus sp.]